ncbi:MAG: hypothetical protein CMN94_01290 [Synechococcus sp. EAC657]|nr:hypothetical protein [Synechococcus sp. EAC657]
MLLVKSLLLATCFCLATVLTAQLFASVTLPFPLVMMGGTNATWQQAYHTVAPASPLTDQPQHYGYRIRLEQHVLHQLCSGDGQQFFQPSPIMERACTFFP